MLIINIYIYRQYFDFLSFRILLGHVISPLRADWLDHASSSWLSIAKEKSERVQFWGTYFYYHFLEW